MVYGTQKSFSMGQFGPDDLIIGAELPLLGTRFGHIYLFYLIDDGSQFDHTVGTPTIAEPSFFGTPFFSCPIF